MRRVEDALLDFDDEYRFYLDGQPFTGISFEEAAAADGTVMSELTYVDGWQSGAARDYYSDGQIAAEDWYWQGRAHGWSRRYSRSGEIVQQVLFELGIAISPTTGEALEPTHATLLARERSRLRDWPVVRESAPDIKRVPPPGSEASHPYSCHRRAPRGAR